MRGVVGLAVLAMPWLAAGCGPPAGVTVEISERYVPTAPFVALPTSGGTMELRLGCQGAIMVAPGVRVTGVADASAGRVEITVTVDGETFPSNEAALTELEVGADGASYHYGILNPFSSSDVSTYLGHTATVRAEVVGGGYEGFAEITVTLVDDQVDTGC